MTEQPKPKPELQELSLSIKIASQISTRTVRGRPLLLAWPRDQKLKN